MVTPLFPPLISVCSFAGIAHSQVALIMLAVFSALGVLGMHARPCTSPYNFQLSPPRACVPLGVSRVAWASPGALAPVSFTQQPSHEVVVASPHPHIGMGVHSYTPLPLHTLPPVLRACPAALASRVLPLAGVSSDAWMDSPHPCVAVAASPIPQERYVKHLTSALLPAFSLPSVLLVRVLLPPAPLAPVEVEPSTSAGLALQQFAMGWTSLASDSLALGTTTSTLGDGTPRLPHSHSRLPSLQRAPLQGCVVAING